MNFRKDINGLRAIAVIAVVLYHFDSQWLTGGFAGVDVFFVISGFLMTGIIFRGIELKSFSVGFFYLARAKRIIPALAFLSLFLLILGWFYLSPTEYSQLGKHVASSMGFFSNVIYWKESGYFDVGANEKWLLHTWSLSVEWQFYIIYPLVLVFLKRFVTLNVLRYSILLACVLGFILSVWVTYVSPRSAFFLLPTRSWEMLLGGVAYIFPLVLNEKNKKSVELAGIALIVISYFTLSSKDLWPGYLALLPAMGAFLVIQSSRDNSIFTSNLLFQNIGTYSYSIYLWHWPVVVLINYLDYKTPSVYLLGGAASFILGFMSYHCIEKRFSYSISSISMRRVILYPPVIAVIFLVSAGGYLNFSNGIIDRMDSKVLLASNESSNKNTYSCLLTSKSKYDSEPCIIGNRDSIKAIVIGDSHADAVITSVKSSIDLEKFGLLIMVRASCPFILGANNKKDSHSQCKNSNDYILKLIHSQYSGIPVFIINRTSVYIYGQSNPSRVLNGDNSPILYFTEPFDVVHEKLLNEFSEHYIDSVCKLSKTNKVYITTPVPEMRVNVPKFMAKNILLKDDYSDVSIPLKTYQKRNEFAINLINKAKNECELSILNTEHYLCNTESCIGSKDGRPLYFDGDHLSEYGNEFLKPMFSSVL